ncbi:MAG: hypothetical protein AAFO72_03585, partial [Pseudomonadota bacterium]
MTQPSPRRPSRAPRGVALINALLIVAALSAVTVALLQRTDASNERLIDLQRAGQAKLYLDAVTLQLTDVIGLAEFGPDGQTILVDTGQTWARPATEVAIGDGKATWQVDDLQGKFNLAWLGRNFESLPNEGDQAPDLNAMIL